MMIMSQEDSLGQFSNKYEDSADSDYRKSSKKAYKKKRNGNGKDIESVTKIQRTQ